MKVRENVVNIYFKYLLLKNNFFIGFYVQFVLGKLISDKDDKSMIYWSQIMEFRFVITGLAC